MDGVCSVIDVQEGKLVASISLATAEAEALMRINENRPYESNSYALYPGDVPIGGICGTPLVVYNRVFVGTTSGQVTALKLKFVDRDDSVRSSSRLTFA